MSVDGNWRHDNSSLNILLNVSGPSLTWKMLSMCHFRLRVLRRFFPNPTGCLTTQTDRGDSRRLLLFEIPIAVTACNHAITQQLSEVSRRKAAIQVPIFCVANC